MSNRFAIVRINDLYMTHNGESGGDPMRCRVPGEPRFATTIGSNSVVAASPAVHTQNIARGVYGVEFDLVFEAVPETMLALIVAELNESLEEDGTVRVIVESLVDFDVQAQLIPQDGAPYTFESRSGGQARGVTIKFWATGPGA